MTTITRDAGAGPAFDTARHAFDSGRTRTLEWRRGQLRALRRMLSERRDEIVSAVRSDLGKGDVEAYLTEVRAVQSEVTLALRNLRRWTRTRRVRSSLSLGLTRAAIQRQPLGVVLIIGPWNYPVNLLLVPLVGALAAGNAVLIKPSEVAPNCSRLLARILPDYLDAEAVHVVQGGVPETTQVLDLPFDHIFYTGNGTVGSIVMAAAAKHLTPVTLELGGKSPVWVDGSTDLERTARTLAWGKYSNCGQTCVAPDYVLTTPDVAPRLAAAIGAAITGFYGPNPQANPDYGRIVNKRHAERLVGLLESGTLAHGGTVDIADRYIAPTVLTGVGADTPVMRDEIFGPILPIVTVAGLPEAIDFINARPKPLALYAFTEQAASRQALLDRTSSGSVAFNAVMIQLGVPSLPFGGVGPSGIGAYHGEHSIRTFSHERAVLRRLHGPDLTTMVHPPFAERKRMILLGRS
jgi:aldehyde dehydrogenase (NAD+)